MTTGIAREDIRLFDEHSVGARELLQRFGEEILENAFPPEQYIPLQFAGTGALEDPVLIACGPDGRILGGACGEIYPRSHTLLLGYIAIRQDLRGAGLGSLLMDEIRERWLDPETLTVLEIEDPRHHPNDEDYGDSEARVRFYAGFGVEALAVPYFQPRLSASLPRSYHLMLGALSVPNHMRKGSGVDGFPIEHFLREYFVACEGEDVLEDEELQWLLSSYRVPEIQLVPIDDLNHIPNPDPPSLVR